jgi:hypothetical protein
MIGEVRGLLVDEYWATTRAQAGMAPTPPDAPGGVLTDETACRRLREAIAQVTRNHDELSDRYDLFFYSVGSYYAVFAHVKRTPAMDGFRGVWPMHVFTNESTPRHLMTIYM